MPDHVERGRDDTVPVSKCPPFVIRKGDSHSDKATEWVDVNRDVLEEFDKGVRAVDGRLRGAGRVEARLAGGGSHGAGSGAEASEHVGTVFGCEGLGMSGVCRCHSMGVVAVVVIVDVVAWRRFRMHLGALYTLPSASVPCSECTAPLLPMSSERHARCSPSDKCTRSLSVIVAAGIDRMPCREWLRRDDRLARA